MYIKSKHTIFSKIIDSDNYFIINPLSGEADIVNPEDAKIINEILLGKNVDSKLFDELVAKGYLVQESEETKLFNSKYLDFLDNQSDDEIQLFFVPNYSCNFNCSYCYQDEYSPEHKPLTHTIVDAFFKYIETEFAGRKKYITIFGGEPLLATTQQKITILTLLAKAKAALTDICIVTNGYTLSEYISILKQGNIREIQVTLDGTEEIHNTRRILHNGAPTFAKIVEGIDACLENNITVNLRMVIDKENIDNLIELSRFAIDKGWTTHPNFKTQIGRNYELHHCQSAPDKLFTRISLYEKLYELTKQHPHILEFYKPAYSLSKFIAEQGVLPDPLFDSCPACKTEWAFDYTGTIYPCTATVGKSDEALGTFYPAVIKYQGQIDAWEQRNIVTIPECTSCNVQLACGGGCGSVAKNNSGKVCSPDCRPIKELLEIGFAAYLDK